MQMPVKHPDLLRANPKGLVPTLVLDDGGVVKCESLDILKDLYGAEALVPTTTTMHIGEFGTFIDALTGLDQVILDKYNKSK